MTMRVLSLACLLLVGFVTCDEVKSYRGHHVISAKCSTEDQLTVLRKLKSHDVVFLREPSLVLSTDMVVPPEQKDQVIDTLRDAGITVTVQSTDLQASIDAEKRQSYVKSRHGRTTCTDDESALCFGHDFYRTLRQVNRAMDSLADLYPHLVTMEEMAHRTHENRAVYYLKVGTPADNNGSRNKPVIFIEGLAHAREWVATASLLFMVDEMLRQYRMGNETFENALQEFTWVIIPMVNPDGYEHSHNFDRLWRKNRRPTTAYGCTGVDLNRNYDVNFGQVGVSNDCGSDMYPGENAFSEQETKNVRDLFLELKPRVAAFLSVHAYSQLLLHPWGYLQTNDISAMPPNFQRLYSTGNKMLNALNSRHGVEYTFGTPHQVLGYAASGGAEDWALQEKPGIYSYCYELRPRDWWSGGFELDQDQIVPTGQEVLDSMLVLAKVISEERQGA